MKSRNRNFHKFTSLVLNSEFNFLSTIIFIIKKNNKTVHLCIYPVHIYDIFCAHTFHNPCIGSQPGPIPKLCPGKGRKMSSYSDVLAGNSGHSQNISSCLSNAVLLFCRRFCPRQDMAHQELLDGQGKHGSKRI
jgi:hypothetical protein